MGAAILAKFPKTPCCVVDVDDAVKNNKVETCEFVKGLMEYVGATKLYPVCYSMWCDMMANVWI